MFCLFLEPIKKGSRLSIIPLNLPIPANAPELFATGGMDLVTSVTILIGTARLARPAPVPFNTSLLVIPLPTWLAPLPAITNGSVAIPALVAISPAFNNPLLVARYPPPNNIPDTSANTPTGSVLNDSFALSKPP